MPVTKELISQIDSLKPHYSSTEIFEAIKSNPKYKDVSEQIVSFKGQYDDDEILQSLYDSPSLVEDKSIVEEKPDILTPGGFKEQLTSELEGTKEFISEAVEETRRPVLETAGMATGELIGAVGGPTGAVTGAGVGFAVGKRLADIAEGKTSDGLKESFVEFGEDIKTGTEIAASGQIFGKAVHEMGKKAIPIAKRLYRSALKPSTVLKPEVVEKRVVTGLREKIPVSQAGLEKNVEEINKINKQVSERIKQYAKEGQTVLTKKAVKPLGELIETTKAKQITPKADVKAIKGFEKEVLKGQPAEIPIDQAQVFKQTINRELDDFYKAINKGQQVPPKALMRAKAAMAKGLREEIATVFPEVSKLNMNEGARIELNKSLGQAINRIKNRELIPLVVAIATGVAPAHSLWKAVLLKTIEHPTVKSKLAIALYTAGKTPVTKEVGKRLLQTGLLAGREDALQEER